MSLHVDVIPNRNSAPAILLRRAEREGKRIRRTTLANLSKAPPELVDDIRALLRGGRVVDSPEQAFQIRRALPHGHVAAVVGLSRQIGLERTLHAKRSRERDLACAAILARVLQPGSELVIARHLSPATASSSLGRLFGLGPVDADELLTALKWLTQREGRIEKSLARRHGPARTILLCDISPSDFEEPEGPQAAVGPNRNGRGDVQQLVLGLLCAADGCPVAADVFPGSTGEAGTVAEQVSKLRDRFGLESTTIGGGCKEPATAPSHENPEPAGAASGRVSETRGPDFPGERVRADMLLRMLAYYVEWHLRQRLAPLLVASDGSGPPRDSPTEAGTEGKAGGGLPTHSFRTLLADLGTLTLNEATLPSAPDRPFTLFAKPTPLQRKAFDLLAVDPAEMAAGAPAE